MLPKTSRALAISVGISLACGGSAPPAPERIVLIVVDTLRADFAHCCGRTPATPAIDALAARGQRFEHAVGSYHQTTMSMGALFTGRTPSLERAEGEPLKFSSRTWCGMARFAAGDEDTCLPADLPTLPERLRRAGYETIGIASNRLLFRPAGFERGFDRWVQVWDHSLRGQRGDSVQRARVQARAANRVTATALLALAKRRSDRFFLYVHYMDAHDYFIDVDSVESWPQLGPYYAASVERVDAGVAALLGGLAAEGLLEDAVVVFTADHGERIAEEHLLEGKPSHSGQPSFEEVLRVPLIVAPPRFGDTDRLVRSEDLFRMISELAGVDDGAATALGPDELFLTEGPWRTYRQGRWKSFQRVDGPGFHLVDLALDPAELYDISTLHPEVEARHRARVAELAQALGAQTAVREELTPEDEDRLRALGYLN